MKPGHFDLPDTVIVTDESGRTRIAPQFYQILQAGDCCGSPILARVWREKLKQKEKLEQPQLFT